MYGFLYECFQFFYIIILLWGLIQVLLLALCSIYLSTWFYLCKWTWISQDCATVHGGIVHYCEPMLHVGVCLEWGHWVMLQLHVSPPEVLLQCLPCWLGSTALPPAWIRAPVSCLLFAWIFLFCPCFGLSLFSFSGYEVVPCVVLMCLSSTGLQHIILTYFG